jgi:penicillin-binding protein 2
MTLSFPHRLGVLLLTAACGALLLVGRLVQMQLVDGERWERRALDALEKRDPIPGRRGSIRDAAGALLAEDRPSFDLEIVPSYWYSQLFECGRCGSRRRAAETPRACLWCKTRGRMESVGARDLEAIARPLGISPEALLERIEEECYGAMRAVEDDLRELPPEQREEARAEYEEDRLQRDRTLFRDVPYELAREIGLHPERHHAFRIRTVLRRENAGGEDFAHVVGVVAERRDGGDSGAATGVTGLEYALEESLRGAPGRVSWRPDPRRAGAKVVVSREEAKVGTDLTLTIESTVQRQAMEALAGADEAAFALVDARTGAVLALASVPSFDPARYPALFREWRGKRQGSPILDRAAREDHVPGSVVKPVVAVAGLLSGAVTVAEPIRCEHFFYRDGLRQPGGRCHSRHDDIALDGALVHSCNIYFETIADRLLRARAFPELIRAGRRFGFGEPTGLETEWRSHPPGEWPGDPAQWDPRLRILAAIGQGSVRTTVAQMARAYAALATGALPTLHLVRGPPVPPRPLGLPPSVMEPIRRALERVAVEGSAHGFGLERLGVACKTGTAQVSDRENRIVGHNAWLAGWVPPRGARPLAAFAIVVIGTEESGAKACAPRLLRFLRAWYGEGAE